MVRQKRACFCTRPGFLLWAGAIGVFLLCLGVRLSQLSLLTYPLPVDGAYYYSVAENLHHGRGFVIDYTWNYLRGIPEGLPVPSNDYWQPLVSIILALAFVVAPVSWTTAQVVAALFGSVLGVLAFWLAWRLSGSVFLGLLGGIYIAFLPDAISASRTTDTPAFFAAFAGAALICVVLGLKEYGEKGPTTNKAKPQRYFIAAGGLSALGFLIRPDGALVLVTATLALLWFNKRRSNSMAGRELAASETNSPGPSAEANGQEPASSPPSPATGDEQPGPESAAPFPWPLLLAMWGTFLILVSPWLVRNYLAFGSPLAGGFVKSMLIAKYADLFTSQPEKLTLAYYLSHGTPYNVSLKLLTLGHCIPALIGTYGWPVLGLALWELCAGARSRTHFPVLFHFVLILCLTSLVLTLVALKGTFHHMVPVFLPLFPAFAILGVQRLWRKVRLAKFAHFRWGAAVLFLGVSGLSGFSLFRDPAFPHASPESRMQLHRNISAYLEQKGAGENPIFCDNPWHYYYFNHKPAYTIPLDPYARIKEVAGRLGVEYLVVSPGVLGRFPDLSEEAREDTSLLLLALVYPFQDLPNSEFAASLPQGELQKRWDAIKASLRNSGTPLEQVEMTTVFQFLAPEITGRVLSSHEIGRLHHRSGRALATVGQFEQAVVSFRKAVRCAPHVPDTYYNLARALFAYGKDIVEESRRPAAVVDQFQDALQNAEKACQMAPGRKDFARLLAEIRAEVKF